MPIDTINQHNRIWSEKSLYLSIIDLSKAGRADYKTLQASFYLVILNEYECGYKAFGRKECDYSDGTALFLTPGESVDMENTHAGQHLRRRMLAFHPQIIPNTLLGKHFDDYTFFSYTKNEALHISQHEKNIFIRCLENISDELRRPVDSHSQTLITKSISLMLDLLKNETGQTLRECVEAKHIELAKKWLSEGEKTVAQIARGLGYPSTGYFSRLFEKVTGNNPGQYQIC